MKLLMKACLPSSCVPVLNVSVWLGGLANVFVGLLGGIWWPFAVSVALSLHIRLPVPLGMVPPIFDATGNALVTSKAMIIATVTLFIAYSQRNPLWLLASLLFFGKSLAYNRDMSALHDKFHELKCLHPLSSNGRKKYPQIPLLMRIHPYFLPLYRDADLGGGVRIRRIKAIDSTTNSLSADIDVWDHVDTVNNSDIADERIAGNRREGAKKPTFFFIHGGGWKGGDSMRHTQPTLLHRLVLNGWIVVACNYRKKTWPHHVDDCYNALKYITEEADTLNIDTSRIIISGASAGGQIAALLYSRINTQSAPLQFKKLSIAAMVLFYPAIDPADDSGFTTTFPFDFPRFKMKKGQSLMGWFFERVILRDDSLKWLSASPLRHLTADLALRKSWPPTLILHGQLDGIVPVEHSLHFLSSLVIENDSHKADEIRKNGKGNDHVDDATKISSTTPSPSEAYSAETVNRKMKGYLSTKYQALPEEILDTIDKPADHSNSAVHGRGSGVSKDNLLVQVKGSQFLEVEPMLKTRRLVIHGEEHVKRVQDDIIIIPGAKHSFEAVGGELVEIVSEGLIDWLSSRIVVSDQGQDAK